MCRDFETRVVQGEEKVGADRDMVVREYKCECGKEFEVKQSIKDDTHVLCQCGKLAKVKIGCPEFLCGFYSGHHGAISKRYLDKGTVERPWNLRNA